MDIYLNYIGELHRFAKNLWDGKAQVLKNETETLIKLTVGKFSEIKDYRIMQRNLSLILRAGIIHHTFNKIHVFHVKTKSYLFFLFFKFFLLHSFFFLFHFTFFFFFKFTILWGQRMSIYKTVLKCMICFKNIIRSFVEK